MAESDHEQIADRLEDESAALEHHVRELQSEIENTNMAISPSQKYGSAESTMKPEVRKPSSDPPRRQATIIPIYAIISDLHLYDTLFALILPSIAFGIPL